MEQVITEQIFEPNYSRHYQLILIGAVCVLASVIIGWYLWRRQSKKPNRYSPLIMMLLGFTALIALGTSFFAGWTYSRLVPVVVNEEAITMERGKVRWKYIREAYLNYDQQLGRFSGEGIGDTTKLLMIIENTGTTHVLSEVDYDVEAIGQAIRPHLQTKKTEEKE